MFVSQGIDTDMCISPLAAAVSLLVLMLRAHCMAVCRRACRCEGGLRTCVVSATNAEFGGDPCVNTFKYLQVNYRCLYETGIIITPRTPHSGRALSNDDICLHPSLCHHTNIDELVL